MPNTYYCSYCRAETGDAMIVCTSCRETMMKTTCNQHDKIREVRAHLTRALGHLMTVPEMSSDEITMGQHQTLHWVLEKACEVSSLIKAMNDRLDEHMDS